MTKEEFTRRLFNQFSGMAANGSRSAKKEIEGHRGRMDAEGFNTWLRAEQAAALQTPALKVFDTVLRASMGTPEDAAQSLADFIHLDHQGTAIDWQYQFEQAAPILSNSNPETSDGWKYRGTFAQYIQAMKAEERAKAFSGYLGQETAQAKPETEFFESIEAMEKALAAARHAGLINEGDKWKFTGYKTHAVSLFWVAAIAAGLAKPTAPVSKVSPFLEKIFNVPLGLNAINKKKKAEEYDRGTDDRVYQRLYNELLTQMGK